MRISRQSYAVEFKPLAANRLSDGLSFSHIAMNTDSEDSGPWRNRMP